MYGCERHREMEAIRAQNSLVQQQRAHVAAKPQSDRQGCAACVHSLPLHYPPNTQLAGSMHAGIPVRTSLERPAAAAVSGSGYWSGTVGGGRGVGPKEARGERESGTSRDLSNG